MNATNETVEYPTIVKMKTTNESVEYPTIVKMKTLEKEIESLLKEYESAHNNLIKDMNAFNLPEQNVQNHRFAGKNIRLNKDVIGFVTNKGIFKLYDNLNTWQNTNGRNGCPSDYIELSSKSTPPVGIDCIKRPFWRLYSQKWGGEFMDAIDPNEAAGLFYTEKLMGNICSNKAVGTVPIYRAYNGNRGHMSALSQQELRQYGFGHFDYGGGPFGYVYPNKIEGSNPIYRTRHNQGIMLRPDSTPGFGSNPLFYTAPEIIIPPSSAFGDYKKEGASLNTDPKVIVGTPVVYRGICNKADNELLIGMSKFKPQLLKLQTLNDRIQLKLSDLQKYMYKIYPSKNINKSITEFIDTEKLIPLNNKLQLESREINLALDDMHHVSGNIDSHIDESKTFFLHYIMYTLLSIFICVFTIKAYSSDNVSSIENIILVTAMILAIYFIFAKIYYL